MFDSAQLKRYAAGHWSALIADITGSPAGQLQAKGSPCPLECKGGTDRYSAFDDFSETGGTNCRKCGSNPSGFMTIARSRGKSIPDRDEYNDVGKWLIEHHVCTAEDLRKDGAVTHRNEPPDWNAAESSGPSVGAANNEGSTSPRPPESSLPSPITPIAAASEKVAASLLVHEKVPDAIQSYCGRMRPGDRVHRYYLTPDLCPFVIHNRKLLGAERQNTGSTTVSRPLHKTVDGWQGGLQMREERPLYALFPGKLPPTTRIVTESKTDRPFSLNVDVSFGHLPNLSDAGSVYICQAERDAEALLSIGVSATCPAFGINGLRGTDFTSLAGKKVTIIPLVGQQAFANRVLHLLKEMEQSPAEVSVKRLEDDDTVSLEPGGGPEQWVEKRTYALNLLDGTDEKSLKDAHRQAVSDSDLRLRDTLASLPDRTSDYTPERPPLMSLAPANPNKTLHQGPTAAASAVAYGLKESGVLSKRRPPNTHHCYCTSDEQNETTLVFVSLRWDLTDDERQLPANKNESKIIRQIASVEGGWQTTNPYDSGRPLYGYDPDARAADTILLTEGEKARDEAQALGIPSVCPSQGSTSPQKTDYSVLAGKRVIILPDHDNAGEKFVRKIRSAIKDQRVNTQVEVRCFADDPEFRKTIKKGDDAYDWVEYHVGKSAEDLRRMFDKLPDKSGQKRFAPTHRAKKAKPRQAEQKPAKAKVKRFESDEELKGRTVYVVFSDEAAGVLNSLKLPVTSVDCSINARQFEWAELADARRVVFLSPVGNQASQFTRHARWLLNELKVPSEVAFCSGDDDYSGDGFEPCEVRHWYDIHTDQSEHWLINRLESLPDHGDEDFFKPESPPEASDDQVSGKAHICELDNSVVARNILKLHYETKVGDKTYKTLVCWNGGFHHWSGAWLPLEDAAVESTVWNHLDKNYERVGVTHVRNVVAAIKNIAFLSTDTQYNTWRNGPDRGFRIAVDDGSLLNPETGALDPPSPDWFSRTKLPVTHNPAATCDRWCETLMANLENDMERYKLLQEVAGYCLWSDLQFQKFLVLVGEGANGKSVFLAGLQALLGSRNTANYSLDALANNRFASAGTIGKLANICADISEFDRMCEGTLKQLTSGDTMTVDRKNKNMIEARPTAKLIFSANNLPRFTDRSSGTYRRMIVCPFLRTIPEEERIHGLDRPDAWQDELPGILNWALEGLQRLLEQRGFTYSSVSQKALEEFQRENNPAKVFLEKFLVPDERPRAFVVKEDAYVQYRDWCGSCGYQPIGPSNFGKEVKRQFKDVKDSRQKVGAARKRVYLGLRMNPLSQPADDPAAPGEQEASDDYTPF